MAVSKSHKKKKQQSYISVPSQIINSISQSSLESLLHSPKKKKQHHSNHLRLVLKNPCFIITFSIFSFGVFLMLRMWPKFDPLMPFSRNPCAVSQENNVDKLVGSSPASFVEDDAETASFWRQPDGMGYKPCLDFSRGYREDSRGIVGDRTKYLLVVVSGGLNQQRNQIVDAVVIARILGAALVVPILQVNVIWGDESEFSDIFDLDHFKSVLANDVRIVSSLPSTHLMTRPVAESRTPLHVSPEWIRSRYLRRIRRDGVLLLRGLDSRLSKDLSSDLQKLRCKVAFHALRFAPRILELGDKLTKRMQSKGPYLALHLRMEKDVWVRTGCLPGLSAEYDEIISNERKAHPKLLTSRSNMTYRERKLAGLCPLNALEVARLLKALGAPKSMMIYWAGGIPLGGKEALLPLTMDFPNFYNKEDLALPGELEPFVGKASLSAAIDSIVAERSTVFMASHGGNMGHAIQGYRAYAGHKKTVIPNKRQMLAHFMDASLSEPEFNKIILDLHGDSMGQPELRTSKVGRDVTKYPIPECMCNATIPGSS
ncbi:O-fucosyltransferase 20-like [Andrographis paniculata]|uniref:O-fucosyltransferase 20-like n=1 Tax=Andrographis paniculata TaxID=175694 RepID=UPI0021E7D536|nr:O-fucosyltransferase 20-like [Andrographis paniculata]